VEDPFYLGSRMPRTHGKEHEEFCDEFMQAVTAKWPKCIIQFEDFQSEYALKYLERYRNKYLHFNDDVQGTAAIVTAGFINGMKSQGTELKDAKVVMFGAGSSAVGVATYLSNALVAKGGLSEEEAKRRIFMIDSKVFDTPIAAVVFERVRRSDTEL
jgi:malic enzyme